MEVWEREREGGGGERERERRRGRGGRERRTTDDVVEQGGGAFLCGAVSDELRDPADGVDGCGFCECIWTVCEGSGCEN